MLVVPAGTERVVPEWFAKALYGIDPSLICYFNVPRQMWMIDRCTLGGMHHVANHTHTAECPKTNVLWLKDADGSYMPPCDAVLDKLRAMDQWSQHGSWDAMTKAAEDKEAAQKQKIQDDERDDIRHASRDGRVQMNKAQHLIEQHDLRLNK